MRAAQVSAGSVRAVVIMSKVTFLLLLIAFAPGPGVVAASPGFALATPVGQDEYSPDSFTFSCSSWTCRVSSRGEGQCISGRKRWAFRLPVDDGSIHGLYFSTREPFVLVYSLTDEESDWGRVARVTPTEKRPKWSKQVPGLNLAAPLRSGNAIIVGALGYVAALSAAEGHEEWQHHWVYDDSGRTVTELSLSGECLLVRTFEITKETNSASVCYGAGTGIVRACPCPN